MDEVEFLVAETEKELYNLITFLSVTFQYHSSANDSAQKERLKQYEQLKNNITTVMTKKDEKMNSIRRNSFVFI